MNQSFTFTVNYTPSGGNGDLDELDVSYASQGSTASKTATDPILGNQALNPCMLSVKPATLSFGTVGLGTPLTKSVTLSNAGESDCNISGVVLDPASDPSYSLASGQAGSFTIAAGTSATIGVTFSLNNSNTPNQRKGDIDYQSNDPSHATGQIPLIAYLQTNSPYANGWPKWHYDNNNSGKTSADTSNDTGQILWQYTGLRRRRRRHRSHRRDQPSWAAGLHQFASGGGQRERQRLHDLPGLAGREPGGPGSERQPRLEDHAQQ